MPCAPPFGDSLLDAIYYELVPRIVLGTIPKVVKLGNWGIGAIIPDQ
jgi:hypothetical protein